MGIDCCEWKISHCRQKCVLKKKESSQRRCCLSSCWSFLTGFTVWKYTSEVVTEEWMGDMLLMVLHQDLLWDTKEMFWKSQSCLCFDLFWHVIALLQRAANLEMEKKNMLIRKDGFDLQSCEDLQNHCIKTHQCCFYPCTELQNTLHQNLPSFLLLCRFAKKKN